MHAPQCSDWYMILCQPEVSENLNTCCFGDYFARKFIIYNHRPSWMTVARSISQIVTCHVDEGFKLSYSQTSIIRTRGDWAEWSGESRVRIIENMNIYDQEQN